MSLRSRSSRVSLSAEEEAVMHRRRRISLAGAFLVALCAGSNYGFSSFAPQLQEQLHLTSTQINIVGAAGNMGVYLSGPVWGKWIDKRGPRTGLILGAALVLLGYGGLSLSYSQTQPLARIRPTLLAVFSLMTGLGNSGAFCACMNTTAKSWGEAKRGTATAVVLSGFGLSAFMWAQLSHSLFPGQTGAYLSLLALGSSTIFLLGLLTIRICPPSATADAVSAPATRATSDGRGEYAAVQSSSAEPAEQEAAHTSPRMPKLHRRRTSSDVAARAWAHTPMTDDSDSAASIADEEEAIPFPRRPSSEASRQPLSRTASDAGLVSSSAKVESTDITGWELFQQLDFGLLFLVMTLISGSGLLVINNIGTITRTLWEYNHADKPVDAPSLLVRASSDVGGVAHLAQSAVVALVRSGGSLGLESLGATDKRDVQQLQAHQVSAISIGNASGRIIIGLLSDLLVRRTGKPRYRVWMLMLVCALALASQAIAAAPNVITTVDKLMAVSILTGLSYGSLMGYAPILTFEWFGLKNFSQNWGYVSLSPVVAGNLFNLLFGRVYDSHVPKGEHVCPLGEECYRSVFKVTEVCAVLAALTSLILIFRRAGVPRRISGLL